MIIKLHFKGSPSGKPSMVVKIVECGQLEGVAAAPTAEDDEEEEEAEDRGITNVDD